MPPQVDNRANAALLTSCEASISRHLELFNPRGQLCHVERCGCHLREPAQR